MRKDIRRLFNKPPKGKTKRKYPRGNQKLKFDERRAMDDLETGPHREQMRKAHSVAHDYDYSERHNWKVLRRLLESNLGRPWDEVYSEICQAFDHRCRDGWELRDWMCGMYVEVKCQMIDGHVYDGKGSRVDSSYGRFGDYYVHPETGLLCKAEYVPWRRAAPEELRPKVLELDDTLYHEHNGTWYRVKFKRLWKSERLAEDVIGNRVFRYKRATAPDWQIRKDVFLGKELSTSCAYHSVGRHFDKKYGPDENGEHRYCHWKQAANSKEIAKLKKKYEWD
jgi:hypothetical protein